MRLDARGSTERLIDYLDTWANIDEAVWPEANVKALHDDIMDIFREFAEANSWMERGERLTRRRAMLTRANAWRWPQQRRHDAAIKDSVGLNVLKWWAFNGSAGLG